MKLVEVCNSIERAIFDGDDKLPEPITLKEFRGGKLKGADIGRYRIIEQNPNTKSEFARRSREGHKILWVFKDGEYYARYEDGILHKGQESYKRSIEIKYEISNFRKLDNDKVVAISDIAYGDVTIKGVKLIKGKRGMFLGMPSTKDQSGTWHENISIPRSFKESILEEMLVKAKE